MLSFPVVAPETTGGFAPAVVDVVHQAEEVQATLEVQGHNTRVPTSAQERKPRKE